MGGRADGDATAAREAAVRGDWPAAFAQLMDLDASGSVEADDLPLLAEVAYAAGHLDVAIAAWERVHRTCLDAGDRIGAAGAAARVAMHLLFDTALMAPVRGWLRRAEQYIEGEPDTPAHAWTAVVRAYERLLSGDRDRALEGAKRAVEIGSRHDPAAAAIGRVAVARLLLLDGDVEVGLALLEEVGVAATGGDLDPLSTGVVYCELVCALQGAAQYDLAEEWTEAMERWCATNAIGSLHGRCRVHRAEILRLRGRYDDAETEASAACDELRPYLRRELGWPLAELGQIRLRRDDRGGAEAALVEAHQVGWDPQPALARVQLARGETAAALDAIRGALDRPVLVPSKERPPSSALHRAPLLAAQVEIEVAGGEIDRARAAADELAAIAERFQSRALLAEAELARGRVLLAEGDAALAALHFEAAASQWRDIRAPYELAIARRELARAYRALGRAAEATAEDEASAALLRELRGDRPDARGDADAVSAHAASRLARDGDVWTIEFAGRTVRVRDRKGIRYLARLLADPGRELHVLDLVTVEHPRSAASDPVLRGDAGEMLDDEARTAYQRRLAEIDDDLDDARSSGDLERGAQAKAEREFLVRELSRAFGIGGRSRKAGAASERARVAITRAIRTAIAHVAEHHPPLGEHLDHAVHTGTYCSYQPDPLHPVRWEL